jgi:hypothetical protein
MCSITHAILVTLMYGRSNLDFLNAIENLKMIKGTNIFYNNPIETTTWKS